MNGEFLVRELFGGPIDVVGDVHGEIQALRAQCCSGWATTTPGGTPRAGGWCSSATSATAARTAPA
ncbi:MAG: hypothetical protein U0797_16200 [Gemmataceae bacterium]